MHERLRSWLLRWARPSVLWRGVLLWLVAQGIMGLALGRTAPERPLDLRFFYTPEQVFRHLAYWQNARAYFWGTHLLLDGLYPLLYAGLLALLLTFFYRDTQHGAADSLPWWVWVVPGIALGADWAENGLLSWLLWLYPRRCVGLAYLAALATAVKWLAVAGALGALVLGVGRFLRRSLRRSGA